MPKVIPGETIPLDYFVTELRDAARWMKDRCTALAVPVYPHAQQLLDVDDSVLEQIQTNRAANSRRMNEQIEDMKNDCLDYIIAIYSQRGHQISRQDISNDF